jgi:hypothetical protein
MEIERHDDTTYADALSSTAALSINAPCVCQTLHRNCNPSTCRTAAEFSSAREETNDTTLIRRSTSGTESPRESTMGDYRAAALRGCTTCAILYSGLRHGSASESWLNDAKNEEIIVEIKQTIEFLRCTLTNGRKRYEKADFVFYASKESGM